MSSNLKVNSLVPATGTEIGIGTTGGSIDFRCAATFGGNVTIGGTLTYDEVINIDSIGIVTARSGLNVQAGQLDVGSNIKLGNAGVITATSFSGNPAGTSSLDAGILDLKTGGNLRLRFSSGGTAQFRGDVDPIANFDRGSANSTNVKWGYLGADRGIISSISNEFRIAATGTIPMTFYSNSNERLRIDSSGRLLLGTTTEGLGTYGEDLTIASSDHAGITIRTGTGHKGTVYFSDATSGDGEYRGSVQYDHSDNSLRLATNSSVRLFINSSGLVNIGAGSSASGLSPLLHLHKNASNSSAYFHITNNDTGITNNDGFLLGINPSGDCLVFNKDSTPIRFATAGLERARILSGGEFAIGGTGYAGQPFSVQTSGNNLGYMQSTGTTRAVMNFRDGNSSQNIGFGCIGNNHVFMKDGSEKVRITSSGQVMIGATSSAAGNLVVKSSDSSSNQVWIIGRSSDNTGSVSFRNNGDSAYTGRIEVEDTNGMIFQVGSSDRLKIDTNGNVTKPNSFHLVVDRSSNQTGYNACNMSDVIIWNRVQTGQSSSGAASHFDTSTGLFTAPVTGLYLFHVAVNCSYAVQGAWLNINGSRPNFANFYPNGANSADAMITYKVTAGQTVGVKWYYNCITNGTINSNALHTWWRIVLLG